jgi:CheY-like chemotaxis protein
MGTMADINILLVDDDEVVRLPWTRFWNKSGFDVTTATNVTEALQYINSIGDGDDDRIAVQGRIAGLPCCHPAKDAVLHGGAVGLREESIGADGIAPIESARAIPE